MKHLKLSFSSNLLLPCVSLWSGAYHLQICWASISSPKRSAILPIWFTCFRKIGPAECRKFQEVFFAFQLYAIFLSVAKILSSPDSKLGMTPKTWKQGWAEERIQLPKTIYPNNHSYARAYYSTEYVFFIMLIFLALDFYQWA